MTQLHWVERWISDFQIFFGWAEDVYASINSLLPVVPHKAVVEASK